MKQFLYAWCGKQKTAPDYEVRAVGSKIRQRFMCEVGIQSIFLSDRPTDFQSILNIIALHALLE